MKAEGKGKPGAPHKAPHEAPRVLIADTTTLFSAVAYDGLEREVLHSNRFEFLVTRKVFEELYKLLITRLRLTKNDALYVLERIPIVVKDNEYECKMKDAIKLIGFRDMSDTPTVALSLSTKNDGIWSSDKDFEVLRGKIKVWKSRELLDFIPVIPAGRDSGGRHERKS